MYRFFITTCLICGPLFAEHLAPVQNYPEALSKAQMICKNPFSVCKNYVPKGAIKDKPFFHGNPSKQSVMAQRQAIIRYFNSTIKPALYKSIRETPGLTAQQRSHAIQIVKPVSLAVGNDRASCGARGRQVNAMAMVGENRIKICEGMVLQSQKFAQSTGQPAVVHMAVVLGHELGHFLEHKLNRNAIRKLGECIEGVQTGNAKYNSGTMERVCDFFGAHVLDQIAKTKGNAADVFEAGYAHLCSFRTAGYAGHPPIPQRVSQGRYSPMANTLGCPADTDKKQYCTFAGKRSQWQ